MGASIVSTLLGRALDSDENYNLLLIGPPASSETLILLGILDIRNDWVYFDGSNTTNRILDVLEEQRPRIICIDELDTQDASNIPEPAFEFHGVW